MKLLALCFLLFNLSAMAAETAWVRLASSLRYRDLNQNCTTEVSPSRFYLRFTTEGDRLSEVVLKRGEQSLPEAPHITLSAEELGLLKFAKGDKGSFTVESIQFNREHLIWVLGLSGQSDCRLPKSVRNLQPDHMQFRFQGTSSFAYPNYLISNDEKFSGELHDGHFFVGRLWWIQSKIDF